MSKKKLYIFVYYDLVKVGHYKDDDVKEILSDNGYRTVKRMFEKDPDAFIEALEDYDDDYDYYFSNINGVKVLEAPLSDNRPYDLISDVFDDIEDISDFVNIEYKSIPIPRKGLAYKQVSEYLGSCAEIIVDGGFVFEPSKISIRGVNSVEYDGKEYEYEYVAGDDNGDYVYYYNGVELE